MDFDGAAGDAEQGGDLVDGRPDGLFGWVDVKNDVARGGFVDFELGFGVHD